jgi:hypothetical protein
MISTLLLLVCLTAGMLLAVAADPQPVCTTEVPSTATNLFKDTDIRFDPPNPTIFGYINYIVGSGTPAAKALSGTPTYVHFTVTGVLIANAESDLPADAPDTGRQTSTEVLLDIGGCASYTGLQTSGLMFRDHLVMTSIEPVVLGNSQCDFTVRINWAQSWVVLGLTGYSGPVGLTVATSASSNFNAGSADNYMSLQRTFYSLLNTTVTPSTTALGSSLNAVTLKGRPVHNIPFSGEPILLVNAPKAIVQVGKAYTVTLSGCSSYGPADVVTTDLDTCNAQLKIWAKTDVKSFAACTLTISPSAASNAGTLMNPSTIQRLPFQFYTTRGGSPYDWADTYYDSGNPLPAPPSVITPGVPDSSDTKANGESSATGFLVSGVLAVASALLFAVM